MAMLTLSSRAFPVFASTITIAALHAQPVFAQASTNPPECAAPRDPARSIALFDEAARLYRTAIKNEDLVLLATACDDFEESQRLEPLAETLVNLAECRRAQGRIATAYAHLRRAEAMARDAGKRNLEREALPRADEIEAARSYLTIRVAARVPQLTVRTNGEVVGEAQFDQRLPVDPGKYLLTASAPGFANLELPVEIGALHDDKTITIPALTPLPAPPPAPLPSPSAPPQVITLEKPRVVVVREPAPRPNIGPWVLGGVGAAAVLVGGVSGALAIRDKHTISSASAQSPCADAHPQSIQTRPDFEWNLARVTVPLGLVALGSAATWLALQPTRSEQPKNTQAPNSISAAFDHQSAQFWLRGNF